MVDGRVYGGGCPVVVADPQRTETAMNEPTVDDLLGEMRARGCVVTTTSTRDYVSAQVAWPDGLRYQGTGPTMLYAMIEVFAAWNQEQLSR